MWVNKTVDMKTWLNDHDQFLQLDLRCKDNRKTFAQEVLNLTKEWKNITEELDSDDVTSHHTRFQYFNKMIAKTNTTCKERKLGGQMK